ncbi:MAG: hypothetical protein Q4A92_03080 [Corynebacterium sp.]|nr:hypothetical protein [Corynebacterium sp.]
MMKVAKKVTPIMATLMLFLSACGASPESETSSQASAPESSATTSAEVASSVSETLKEVDVEKFNMDGNYMFQYSTGGTPGTCRMTSNDVMCAGTADDSVPNVNAFPHTGRPSSVIAHDTGISYYIMEGIRSADQVLNVGEQVTLGSITCSAPAEDKIECSSAGGAFTISGKDRLVSSTSPVTDYKPGGNSNNSSGSSSSEPTTTNSQGERPANAIKCGQTKNGREVEIWEGDISCAEAVDLMHYYDTTTSKQGVGNTMSVEFDGWGCFAPTAKSSEIHGYGMSCEKEPNIHIVVPL